MAVDPARSSAVRRDLRLVAPSGSGTTRRHFVKESTADRRKLLAAYKGLDGVEVGVWEVLGDGTSVDRRGTLPRPDGH